jgi:hypothetical protein
MANKEFEALMRDSDALLEKVKQSSRGPEEDMAIFHWNEAARTWDKKLWPDWMLFMGVGSEGEKLWPLAGSALY